jgi:Calcineurin-like phosphoesterase.
MGTLYAMSDIHGFYDLMLRNLEYLDLSEPGTRLIFCGDYVDGGTDGCRVLYKIKELTERYPLQVVALKGNHETMFLDFLEAGELDIVNVAWAAIQLTDAIGYNFLSATCREKLRDFDFPTDDLDVLFRAARIVQKDILENHKDLVQWMKHLPYYYETETQIFVHAGINEEAGNRWKQATSEDDFVNKYPASFGKFYKDIIAGHIATSSLAGDPDFHGVFWDKQSHYYIDGTAGISHCIPLLKYDTEKREYTAIRITENQIHAEPIV